MDEACLNYSRRTIVTMKVNNNNNCKTILSQYLQNQTHTHPDGQWSAEQSVFFNLT